MNYPDYWICKNCKQLFSEHLKIGDINEEEDTLITRNWCYGPKSGNGLNWHNYMAHFDPMDNLDIIEELAKQKNLI